MIDLPFRSELAPYADRLAEARSRQAQRCPACGSERIQPLFLDDTDTWDCAELDCLAMFVVQP